MDCRNKIWVSCTLIANRICADRPREWHPIGMFVRNVDAAKAHINRITDVVITRFRRQ